MSFTTPACVPAYTRNLIKFTTPFLKSSFQIRIPTTRSRSLLLPMAATLYYPLGQTHHNAQKTKLRERERRWYGVINWKYWKSEIHSGCVGMCVCTRLFVLFYFVLFESLLVCFYQCLWIHFFFVSVCMLLLRGARACDVCPQCKFELIREKGKVNWIVLL